MNSRFSKAQQEPWNPAARKYYLNVSTTSSVTEGFINSSIHWDIRDSSFIVENWFRWKS